MHQQSSSEMKDSSWTSLKKVLQTSMGMKYIQKLLSSTVRWGIKADKSSITAPQPSLSASTLKDTSDVSNQPHPRQPPKTEEPSPVLARRLGNRVSVHDVVNIFEELARVDSDHGNEKFVVNLYESRRSKRWERHSFVKTKAELKKLRKSCNISLPAETLHIAESRTAVEEKLRNKVMVENDELFFELRKKADFQGEMMKQSSLALEMCRNKGCDSSGEVEAERLLLLATQRYEVLLQHIRERAYVGAADKRTPLNGVGSVEVSELSFVFEGTHSEHLVCLLSHDTTVLATEVIKLTDDVATFKTTALFENVPSDFVIQVKLFLLKRAPPSGYFENVMKKYRKSKRSYPKRKIWRRDVNSAEAQETEVLETAFVPCGSFQLTRDDLNKNTTKHIETLLGEPSLVHASARLTTKDLRIQTRISGFLTVSRKSEGFLAWERRWCTLEGTVFRMWRFPLDEGLNEPAEMLNLRLCGSCSVKCASRNRCARPKTLLLDTVQAGEPALYFLSADGAVDFNKWIDGLREVIGFLRSWKVYDNLERVV